MRRWTRPAFGMQIKPASQTQEASLTFTMQGAGSGDKRNGPIGITTGVGRGDEESFQTLHEANAPKGTIITMTYSGKFSGDTIPGNMPAHTAVIDYGFKPWQIEREANKPTKGEDWLATPAVRRPWRSRKGRTSAGQSCSRDCRRGLPSRTGAQRSEFQVRCTRDVPFSKWMVAALTPASCLVRLAA